jgi:hypothetical protein
MENNKKPDNPWAFPLDANTCLDEYKGMTLRDYFAAKAMNGMNILAWNIHNYDELVKRSYQIADEMLKQREL